MSDRVARVLAGLALAVALVAVVLAGWAVALGQQYLDDVRVLGETLGRGGTKLDDALPMHPPPPELER